VLHVQGKDNLVLRITHKNAPWIEMSYDIRNKGNLSINKITMNFRLSLDMGPQK
jgi:hypothetical protein